MLAAELLGTQNLHLTTGLGIPVPLLSPTPHPQLLSPFGRAEEECEAVNELISGKKQVASSLHVFSVKLFTRAAFLF